MAEKNKDKNVVEELWGNKDKAETAFDE